MMVECFESKLVNISRIVVPCCLYILYNDLFDITELGRNDSQPTQAVLYVGVAHE